MEVLVIFIVYKFGPMRLVGSSCEPFGYLGTFAEPLLHFRTISGGLLSLGLGQAKAKGMGEIWARLGPGLGQAFGINLG